MRREFSNLKSSDLKSKGLRSVPFHRLRNESRLLILAVAALLLSACAAQGPPRPPRVEKPERITDLAVAQVGRTLELSFTLPALATDGEGLSKPLEIQIFRAVAPPGQKSSVPAAEPQPWVTLLPSELHCYALGAKIVYPYRLSEQEFAQWLGASFAFTAGGLTRGFRHRPVSGDLSSPASATLLDVCAPVENLSGGTSEHALELSWSPPTASLSGQPLRDLAGYRVFRSETQTGPFQLRGEATSASYHDTDFQFEHSYFYKVRAAFRSGSQVAESEDSKIFAVTPHDIFPPAAPAGLSAISTAVGVELIWNANTESDLAGYYVYRREDAGAPQKLNTELVGTPLYRDDSAKPGHQYTYWITAVDLARNESAPSAETTVEAH